MRYLFLNVTGLTMETTIDAIFKPEELRAARTEMFAEQVKELRAFARRADAPAKRVVLCELEQRLNVWRAELEQAGLVEPQAA